MFDFNFYADTLPVDVLLRNYTMNIEYRLGISTISGFVAQVCEAIWSRLKDECMPQPSAQTWLEISNKFETFANFPNYI